MTDPLADLLAALEENPSREALEALEEQLRAAEADHRLRAALCRAGRQAALRRLGRAGARRRALRVA
jgi:hypothetical protein